MRCLVPFVFLVLAAFAVADKVPDFVIPGKCPRVNEAKLWKEQVPKHASYAGQWYQWSMTENPYQPIKQCNRVEYSFDGKAFKAKTTGLDTDGNPFRHNGQLYPNPFGESHLSIDYENTFAAPYVVVDTDYAHYSCIYSCIDYDFDYYSDFAFIFSRSQDLPDEYLRKCETAFREIGVDLNRFNRLPHGSNCRYDVYGSL
ncbi:hypothetical protein Pmani_028558 [Petrolisthes manimaculis]|uniref:Lipocalin/cytosolic fatty-acid binding domain-containing protein n=1 Tax=Petrolisthes manimaculis TaxID=1843537 RepID=A0AAE1P0K4_9EUCA|nr:hypothetical protein Pmani_028558 [Petrolisthes manimaculis]